MKPTTQKKLQIAAGVTLAVLLAPWLLQLLADLFGTRGEEGGIRVKNGGSIHLDTTSKQGFEWAFPLHFKTKGKTKGQFTLTVLGGQCGTTPNVLTKVKALRIDLTEGAFSLDEKGGRIHVRVLWLTWWRGEEGTLSGGGEDTLLWRVEAQGLAPDGTDATMQCSFEGASDDAVVEVDIP